MLKRSSEAFLKATNLNYCDPPGRVLGKVDELVKKLQPWMRKAKHKTDASLKNNKKIKVISVKQKTAEIDDPVIFDRMVASYPKILFASHDAAEEE
eukprot:CAMPEP_0168330412 /NCGR_PEP_ID=MMETSP0213-20121227/7718_1 /TAXON_ID=151035 /ORGANISM="Euplotes harpa, Strain FSP1.4" /LENGTH=95 /DNA_ID=CAMNT_0008333983 /DNA_START=383 /DNA_END=667 /DNA_ORIENTATION=-